MYGATITTGQSNWFVITTETVATIGSALYGGVSFIVSSPPMALVRPRRTPSGLLSGNGPPSDVELRASRHQARQRVPGHAAVHAPRARRPHARGQNAGGR